jgi:mannose-6-phosphate isomerase-like protein (cupin superfamily)
VKRDEDVPGASFVEKGWGYEKWIVNTPEYCGKILHVEKGKRCSWHYHLVKEETFYVQSGRVMVFIGEDSNVEEAEMLTLAPGESLHISPGMRHFFFGLTDVDIFEFSTHHEESDSIRLTKGD